MAEQVRVITNITKEYPDMYKIIIYKTPRIFLHSDSMKRNREDLVDYSPKISSLNRTRTLVKDLVLCNNFELFCTFTFDPKKVDSFNFGACYHKISAWISHQRDNSRKQGREFKYLIIPEQHKSGRWHFHALISGYVFKLRDSKVRTTTLRPIYNITSFRSGFTTASPIDDAGAVSEYVSKYITKSFVTMFNQRRFFASRNLIRPRRELNSRVWSFTLPLFRRRVAETFTCEEFVIDKSTNPVYYVDKPNVVQYRNSEVGDISNLMEV